MLNNDILGIDIGSNNIGFAIVRQGKRHYVVDTALSATPDKSIVNGEIKDVETLCRQINEVISSKKLKAKCAALCISSPQVVTREFKIPTVKNSEIYNSIQLDLLKNYPGIEQTHITSFKVYSRTKEFIEGIVTMCPNKIMETYLAIVDMLNISVKYVDVSSNSIAKTYKNFIMSGEEDRTVLIVNIGFNNSEINILNGGRVILSRTVSCGGSSIDKAVAKELNVSEQEAEMQKLKKFKEYVEKGYYIDGFIKKGYSVIEHEIGQTINLYKQNNADGEIKEILLIGGGSFIPGIDDYIKEVFNLTTTVVRPTHNNTIYINQFSRLISAIGCAIREEK